jgi:hypothetical protein
MQLEDIETCLSVLLGVHGKCAFCKPEYRLETRCCGETHFNTTDSFHGIQLSSAPSLQYILHLFSSVIVIYQVFYIHNITDKIIAFIRLISLVLYRRRK